MDVRQRMLKASEDADKALMGDPAPPEPQPGDTPAGISDGTPEPKPDPDPQPPEPKHDDSTVEQLKAEVSRLTAILSDENNQTYKARYQSLQGMFNAETARMRAEIEELKQAVAAPAPQPQTPDNSAEYDLLVEEVGEKTAKILKPYLDKIASLEATVSGVSGEVKATKEKAVQVEKLQAQTADERFFSTLESTVPDWKKVNGWDKDGIPQDPRFTGFMGQTIPGTAMTYQDALTAHYQTRNAVKVAEIFDLFKKTVGIIEPQKQDKPKPSAEVDKYIEPDKTGKGANKPDPGPEIIPHSEYDAFVASLKKGTFKGTREERAKLEAKYDKAIAENRIR